MQGEMGGVAPERRCHAKATCSKEVGSEGEGRRQRVVLVFVFCKIVPKYHLGPWVFLAVVIKQWIYTTVLMISFFSCVCFFSYGIKKMSIFTFR